MPSQRARRGLWLAAACLTAYACGDRAADTTGRIEPAPAAVPDLSIGDAAPDFTLPGSDGRTYRLSDYRGRQAVVLAWFSKAFSAG